MGNRYLRKLLVVGAHAVLYHRNRHEDALRVWAKRLIDTKPFRLVAVALANKLARIAFAIATVAKPNVLIVDETLSVGDVFFQNKCEERIRSFIESGDVTVLFVSHSIEQVERICQRAVWIEKGEQRMDGPVNEVCEAYRGQFK